MGSEREVIAGSGCGAGAPGMPQMLNRKLKKILSCDFKSSKSASQERFFNKFLLY
jgi:hypothetical protein